MRSGKLINPPDDMQEREDIPLPGLFQIAADLVRDELYRRLREAGYPELRPTHGCVFSTISRGGDRLTVLAERADMTKQAVGEVVSELEEIGYVERVPDASDGRAKIIQLSERGQAAWAHGRQVIADFQRELGERYGEERVRDMVALLSEIAADTRPERDPIQAAHANAA
jgi:DNA-binding MarR family transcriptional regulator